MDRIQPADAAARNECIPCAERRTVFCRLKCSVLVGCWVLKVVMKWLGLAVLSVRPTGTDRPLTRSCLRCGAVRANLQTADGTWLKLTSTLTIECALSITATRKMPLSAAGSASGCCGSCINHIGYFTDWQVLGGRDVYLCRRQATAKHNSYYCKRFFAECALNVWHSETGRLKSMKL